MDTAEAIVTLNKLGMDPANWKSSQGFTPVDYMMQKALNSDGSFGAKWRWHKKFLQNKSAI
ncbi:hypothetical protein [Thermoanaerobacterium sp. DL9XJH110]|uniref:hypothetical protein n=1 Tax=Thermoanaerobacterium sp. DL9XJH110 TaxID=3386643 RepID=UPI003BB7B52C